VLRAEQKRGRGAEGALLSSSDASEVEDELTVFIEEEGACGVTWTADLKKEEQGGNKLVEGLHVQRPIKFCRRVNSVESCSKCSL
jgi:hypothetical protein